MVHFKKEIEEFKSHSKVQILTQFISHKLHLTNMSVIVDADDNPKMNCGGVTYNGQCHPLFVGCTYVIIVYCNQEIIMW